MTAPILLFPARIPVVRPASAGRVTIVPPRKCSAGTVMTYQQRMQKIIWLRWQPQREGGDDAA